MKKLLYFIAGIVVIGVSLWFYQKASANIYGSSLVGWWNMDNNKISGTSVTDLSGNGLTGTLTNSPTTGYAGKPGQSVNFIGASNTYMSVNDNAVIDLTTAGTLAVWAKSAGAQEALAGLITKNTGGTCNVADQIAYSLEWGNTNNLRLVVCDGTTADVLAFAFSPTTNTGWVHLAGTWDGANMRLYINGVEVKSVGSTRVADTNNNAVKIGGDTFGAAGGTVDDFNGLIDDARIYNRALAANEIAALYYKGLTTHFYGL